MEMSRERADETYRRLRRMYPDAKCSLDFETPFQLLVATILSAQSTDKKINEVTPELFRKYPSPQAFVSADTPELETDLKQTGFFRQKAKSVQGASAAIVKEHGGEVPAKLDKLVELPGVGRKTANVVMGNAFGKATGVVVDTHVKRVSGRLGMTSQTDPEKIEVDLTGALSEVEVGEAGTHAHPARPQHLRRSNAQVRGMRPRRHLPQLAGVREVENF